MQMWKDAHFCEVVNRAKSSWEALQRPLWVGNTLHRFFVYVENTHFRA